MCMAAASMEFLGYPIAEWSILVGILTTILGLLIKYIGGRVRGFADRVIDEFKKETVEPLVHSINQLSGSFEKETDWIHNQHQQVVKRLDDHEDKLKCHEDRLDDHHDRLIKQELKGGK